MLWHVAGLHFANGCQRRRGTNSFRPIGAGDERVLSGFHDLPSTNNGCRGVTVAEGFREDGHVRLDSVSQMGTAQGETPSGRDFVQDEDRPCPITLLAYSFQESRLRIGVACRFHNDGSNFVAVASHQVRKPVEIVVAKGEGCAGQVLGDAQGLQAGQKMAVQSVRFAAGFNVRGEVPVVPTVVATEDDSIALRCGAAMRTATAMASPPVRA